MLFLLGTAPSKRKYKNKGILNIHSLSLGYILLQGVLEKVFKHRRKNCGNSNGEAQCDKICRQTCLNVYFKIPYFMLRYKFSYT